MTFSPSRLNQSVLAVARSGDNLRIPRPLLHSLGLNVAAVYISILDRHRTLNNKDPGPINDNGFFPFTVGDLEAETGLSYGQQKRAISRLVDLDLIEQADGYRRRFRVLDSGPVLAGLVEEGREKIESLTE